MVATLKTKFKRKPGDGLFLSFDYGKIFKNRLVIITGLSRSGTSILAKLVGSLKGVLYLHEPAIMRFLPVLARGASFDLVSDLLKGLLFEDYYLQLLHGRNLNYRKSDNSFIGNYEDLNKIKKRWVKYERRQDVLTDIYKCKYIFLLKITEIQPLLPVLDRMFWGMRIIHIIRNGNEVISSSIKREWYSDKHLNNNIIQWVKLAKPKIPWFVPDKDRRKFSKWNNFTRIAYFWRTLTELGIDCKKDKKNYLELRYEDLIENPEKVTSVCENFLNLKRSRITSKHILAIKKHILTAHPNQSNKVDKKERANFEKFMKKLGY